MENIKNTSNQPLVSVIVPVYNGAKHLSEAIDSVQKNTFKNYEIILVNDGSSDESKELCHALTQKYSNISFYDFPENRGLSNTLNFALQKAQGAYICRLNQDDIMLPNRLETQVSFLNMHPEVVALGSYIQYFGDNSEQITFMEKDREIKKTWLLVSPFADPAVMYRKEIALKVGGYDQNFWPVDDTQMWYKMGKFGELANIQKALVKVRWHKDAASIKYFRTLTIKYYQMHLWADDFVEKASIFTHLFWLGQLISGLMFSAQFNWGVYRLLKRFLNLGKLFQRIFLKRKYSFGKVKASSKKGLNILSISK